MVVLNDEFYMAEGFARKCYFYPGKDGLCIKIGKPDVDESHLYKEINYYNKIKKKNTSKFDYPFYSLYHGTIETNLGEGFVYDLVRDETTQHVSKTLLEYLYMKDCPYDDSIFDAALIRLKDQMIKHKVFASDLRPRNICCKILKDESIELIIIDGIGHRDFFPLADWFGYFAKQKIERRFQSIFLENVDYYRKMIKQLNSKKPN